MKNGNLREALQMGVFYIPISATMRGGAISLTISGKI